MIVELISAVVVLAASNGGPTAPTPSPGQPQPTPTAAPARTPGPAPAPTLAPSPTPMPTAVRPASVTIVWHLAAAPSSDQSVRAAAIALSAPDTLGAIERALRAHPRARFSLAIDASALAGLQSAAEGDSALQAMVSGHLVGGARADMLRVLAQVPVFDSSLAMTPAARRYRSLAAAAPLALAGQRSATFNASDYVELAGLGALTRLAAVGQLGSLASDLDKSTLTDAQAVAAAAQLAAVDRTTLDELKQLALSGQLELIADPAGEPILPLLIDGGGKTGANIVMIGAGADAAMLSDQALHGVGALQSGSAGVYSPHGAYDDATATMLAQHHAAFALFSDRVLRSSPIGGSREAVLAADSAAYHAYALHAAAGPALSALFWSQDDGTALSVLPPGLPAGAMGERVSELARTAGARGGDIIVLRVEAEGLWNRRSDRAHVVDALAAALSDRVTSVTVAQYLHAHPPTASSFGFAPAADAGSLAYWMGTLNQAKMWTALGDARQAAGGDAALARESTRTALFETEASRWYLTPNMIAPQSEVDRLMGQFRSLVARIYQTSGKSAPTSIAPLSPEPTPRPHQ